MYYRCIQNVAADIHITTTSHAIEVAQKDGVTIGASGAEVTMRALSEAAFGPALMVLLAPFLRYDFS
jgi:predicted MFS family arabinose efflux permease